MKCKYECYGVYEAMEHLPNAEEEMEIKKRLAQDLLPKIIENMQVIRCHYPAGEFRVNETWTYGVKLYICNRYGKPDNLCDDKTYHERGMTALKKSLGFAPQEIHYPEKVLLDLSIGKAVNGDGYEEDASRSSGK